jgi:hypothetical protein
MGVGKTPATSQASKGLVAGVRIPGNTPEHVLEALVEAQIEAAADWNTWWFLDQWERGNDPPCCAGCAGLLYVPDELASSSSIDVAPLVLAAGQASCGPAVAYSLGHERAAAMLAGSTPDEARAAYRPHLMKAGNRYWHAVVVGPDGKVDDVTEEMRR